MRVLFISLAIVAAIVATARADVSLDGRTRVAFATAEQGRKIITGRDDYIQRLSPFERAAKMKTDRETSEGELLSHYAANVVEWTDDEKTMLEGVVANLRPRFEELALPFPETVLLVKTTGEEEGGAAYTRANAVFLPKGMLGLFASSRLHRTVPHELFHVLTRQNPALQEKLFEAIGFQKCREVPLPSKLRPLQINNPDAPRNDHIIRVTVDGKEAWALPILYSRADKYDTKRGGTFFDYLTMRFLVVGRNDAVTPPEAVYDDANPRLVEAGQLKGLYEQVGRNTGYIIHPEETLADNFALLVTAKPDTKIPSPEILKKMQAILDQARLGPPVARKSDAGLSVPAAAGR